MIGSYITRLARRFTAAALLTLAALAVGCAGDPDLAGTQLETTETVPYAVWSGAPAGCEGLDLEFLTLASVEGQPLLAALIHRDGSVACVDALAVLLQELDPSALDPAADDPSPQPSDPTDPNDPAGDPGPDGTGITLFQLDADEAGGTPTSDPTPTPMYGGPDRDPTPTPMYPGASDPDEDPTPTPMLTTGGPNGDPTPTPMYGG